MVGPALPPPAPGVPPRPPLRPSGRSERHWPVLVGVALGAVLLAGVVGALIGAGLTDDNGGDRVPAAAGTGLDVKAVAQQVGPSVVTISADVGGGEAVGTGVVVSKDGEILTNAHVI